jgi:hypothetical protein
MQKRKLAQTRVVVIIVVSRVEQNIFQRKTEADQGGKAG